MGKGGCSREGARIVLWMAWVINMLITTVYYILCFATASYLGQGYDQLELTTLNVTNKQAILQLGVKNNIWRAPIAACVLGGVLVLLFNLMGCIILLKKTINKSGPGFGYGFLTAFCFTLSFFVLLVGVVLEGFTLTVESKLAPLPYWGDMQTGTFKACTGFSFLCFCLFFIFFLVLVIFQTAVSDQLGIDNDVNSAGAAPGGGGGKKGRFGFGKGKGAVGADVGMVPLSSDAPAEGTDPALAAGGVDALDPNAINLAAVEQQQYDYGTGEEQAYGYGQDGGYGYGDYTDPPPAAYGYGQQAGGYGQAAYGAPGAYGAAPAYQYGTAQAVQPGMPPEQQFGYPPQQQGAKPPAYGYDNDSVV